MLVRHARTDDASAIAAIYNDAIARTTSSFWTEPRPVEEIRAAIPAEASGHPWLVAEEACVVGFAWSKPWNPREAYARTVEVSVYVAEGARGRGVGRALYETLFDRLAGLGHRREVRSRDRCRLLAGTAVLKAQRLTPGIPGRRA
ncbi:MAG: N-acetyltransferase family protein [Planctomycetota bacterium]